MASAMKPEDLPSHARERAAWIAEASKNSRISEARFDIWAQHYDDDNGELGWCAPAQAVSHSVHLVPREARILDAGAGSGLVGEALIAEGYSNIVGGDRSGGMLEVAKGKGIYLELHKFDLTECFPFPDDCFDALYSVGTSGYLTRLSFEEFVRVVRPHGHVVFTISDSWYAESGFQTAVTEFEHRGLVNTTHVGGEFLSIPRAYPGHKTRVRVLTVGAKT